MSNHGFALFAERPRRINDLMRPYPIEKNREYEVVQTIQLDKIDYENFITDMVADRRFLEENAPLCSKKESVIRCLRVTQREIGEGILIVPDGAWVDIAALEPETMTKEA